MGCCLSRHVAPAATTAHSEEGEEDTQQLHHATSNDSVPAAPAAVPARPALADRYNRPLVRRPPWQAKTPVTGAQLQVARSEFWETRVTGRAEVWMALKSAAELLERDIALAQVIVDAAGVNVPTGTCAAGGAGGAGRGGAGRGGARS